MWCIATARVMLKVYECIQEPGDVLYVPEMWAHGT